MTFRLFRKLSSVNVKCIRRLSATVNQTKMTDQSYVIAVCQMTSTNDKEHNLSIVKQLVRKAKELKADIVFLPEACDFLGTSTKETLQLAEPLNGYLMETYKKLAINNNVWLSVGGFHELTSTTPKPYNTHALINNLGEIKGLYRKLHMFDVFIPEKQIDLRESKVSTPGNDIVNPISTPAGNIGLSICYDLRFPEISTILRKLGATILTYPSAFTHATGEAHWETLLRARAIENQCYVVAAAQVGVHNPKRISHGRAMIVDPWGKILAECPKHSESYIEQGSVRVAEIKKSYLNNVRQQMPVLEHRRNDIYTLKVNQLTNSNVSCAKGYNFSDKFIPLNTVFYQTPYSFAFTNIRCVLPGHVLIASKRIVPRLKDLTEDEIADLFRVTVRVQTVMETVHDASSTSVVVQDGKDAGQTVSHVHVHILPRKKGDFQRNDDIYDALARHDQDSSNIPSRDLTEMIAEADQLKKMMLNH